MKTCSIYGCSKIVNARGLCGKHYRHAQISGLFGTKCSIDNCFKPCAGRGLCSTHYAANRRAENRDNYNKYQRTYIKTLVPSAETRQKISANGERYRKKNLLKFADKERVRRSIKRSNGGKFSRKDWLRLLNRFRGLCAYCGTNKATTVDHVIPIKKGGTSFIGNLLPACFSCNSSKQDTLLFEWRIKWKQM